MLTAFDKWDWYLPDKELVKKYQKEKHNVTKLCNEDEIGVWGTGCHFPLEKKYFKNNFFNYNFNTLENLIYISWFIQTCKKNNWKLLLHFDSPIFDYYEHELLVKITKLKYSRKLIKDNFLLKQLYDEIKTEIIYEPGLIGFADENKIKWNHKDFKNHPGSLVHYLFSKKYIFPLLDKHFTIKQEIDLNKVNEEQYFWEKSSCD